MNHLDLFSGIGGFVLAARWAGFQTIGLVEIDPWCRKVLAKNFPGVPQYDDVRTLTSGTVHGWLRGTRTPNVADDQSDAGAASRAAEGQTGAGVASRHRGQFGDELDLITAGYPCQPFSHAGKRLGEADDRHLWPEVARLLADLRPRFFLGENVAGHISMGLDDVLSDLEALGYTAWPVVVPACAVGAQHRRDRIWIVAVSGGWGCDRRKNQQGEGSTERGRFASSGSDVADAARQQSHGNGGAWNGRTESANSRGRQALSGVGDETARLSGWMVGPGIVNPWAGDWEAGMSRTTDHEVDRVNKLKALGNAIVPEVAYVILAAMVESS